MRNYSENISSFQKTTYFKVIFIFLLLLGILFVIGKVSDQFQKKNSSVFPSSILKKEVEIMKKNKAVERIGFLPSWSLFETYHLDPGNFSQIIYFGLGVNSDGSLIKFDNEGTKVIEWERFTSDQFALFQEEATKSKTKILISIKNFDNATIDNLISNANAVDRFIQQVQELIETYNLNGVNIDFEYVTDSSFPTRIYFAPFIKHLSGSLKEFNPQTIVSVDVNNSAVIYDQAYDISEIGKQADQIIFMGYDYRRIDSTISGFVAPLYSDSSNTYSIHGSIQHLASKIDLNKIILAVPLYGYEWQTFYTASHSATILKSGALATYKRIKQLLFDRNDIQLNWDPVAKSPWLSFIQNGTVKQIYYEDDRSLQEKYNYVLDQNLGGIAFWALGYEGNNPEIWTLFQ